MPIDPLGSAVKKNVIKKIGSGINSNCLIHQPARGWPNKNERQQIPLQQAA